MLRQLQRSLIATPLHPRYLANRAIRRALRAFAPSAHGKMLDVGCGYKPYRSFFAPYVQEHLGMDIPVTIHGMEAVDVGGSALALPFAAAEFDTVLATEVLEHVPSPDAMLAEIARVLRPGGVLILSAPLHEPLHELPYDYFRYTHIALQALLERNGFTVQAIERRGGPVSVLAYGLSSFLYRRFGMVGYPGRGSRPRPLVGPPVIALCSIIQLLGVALDPCIRDEFDTLGFVVLAEKCRSNTAV
jgi:SAM-dependent methyltransferase